MYSKISSTKFYFLVVYFIVYVSTKTNAQDLPNGKGCKFNRESYEKVELIPPPTRGEQEAIPKKYSLKQYAPEPRNQGDYGTCVGWALAYSARTIQLAKHYDWKNSALITDNAFSPYFLYEKIKKNNDKKCSEGTELSAALDTLKRNGVLKFHEYEHTCNGNITQRHETKAAEYKIKNYLRLFDFDSNFSQHLPVKKVLAGGNPVVIGVGVTNSFKRAKGIEHWQLKEAFNAKEAEEGHAMTVVGYDDDKFGGAFEIMNSWGTAWGKGGFVWISYKDFEKICFQAYAMQAEDSDFFEWNGGFQIKLSNDENMPFDLENGIFKSKESYTEGTRLKFQLYNKQPTYIYIFGTDASNKIYNYFPSQNISAYLSTKNQNPIIPEGSQFIEMDNTTGIDSYCVLYSQEKLPIEDILRDLGTWKTDSFEENIYQILKQYQLKTYQDITLKNSEKSEFKVPSHKAQAVPIFIHIKHL